MNEEEKKAIRIEKESTKLETLIELLYTDRLSQYGKRELVNYIEKQQKEIEEKNIAVNKMSKDISRQLEEIDEKSTIIMVGAEKVKQLEKEIEEYKEHYENMKWYYDNQKDNLIHKDKIREKIEGLKEIADEDNPDIYIKIDCYEELLEENDE